MTRNQMYREHPTHPLHNVPQEILDAARFVMSEAVECRDITAAHANPLADATVMALLPWLTWTSNVAGGDADVPEHTARHGLGMGSQENLITCSCGQVGWVSAV